MAYTLATTLSALVLSLPTSVPTMLLLVLELSTSKCPSIQAGVQDTEVVTNDVFKYAPVWTVLKSSLTPGVCEGFFFCRG